MEASYWTTEQAARFLGVTTRHVRRLCQCGTLAGFQTGYAGDHGSRGSLTWFVSPASCEQYREQQRRYKAWLRDRARQRARLYWARYWEAKRR